MGFEVFLQFYLNIHKLYHYWDYLSPVESIFNQPDSCTAPDFGTTTVFILCSFYCLFNNCVFYLWLGFFLETISCSSSSQKVDYWLFEADPFGCFWTKKNFKHCYLQEFSYTVYSQIAPIWPLMYSTDRLMFFITSNIIIFLILHIFHRFH